MGAISLQQFERAVAAIDAYRALVKGVYDLFYAAGEDRVDGLGGAGLVNELSRQLEERCNDPNVIGGGGSMIDYMLYEGRSHGGKCISKDPPVEMLVNSPAALWKWWEATATGPFTPPAESGSGVSLSGDKASLPPDEPHQGSTP